MRRSSNRKIIHKVSIMAFVLIFVLANVIGVKGPVGIAYADNPPVTIENPGFETGDLSGWTTTGDAFSDSPSNAAVFWGDHAFKQEGAYQYWGWNPNPGADERKGTLKSSTFTLAGNGEINFLVGGGNDLANLYVALVRESDGQILYKATGYALPDQYERYVRVKWDASPYLGESVYLEVVDNSSMHINVDDFHVYNVTNSIENPSFETGDLTGWKVEGSAFLGAVSAEATYSNDRKMFHHKGNYHVWGLAGAPLAEADARTGSIQSTTFRLEGTGQIDFLIGGSNDIDQFYVALVRASDGTELLKSTGPALPAEPDPNHKGDGSDNFETYKRVIWDASAYLGEVLLIKVVDKGNGHINVDDFHVYKTNHELVNPDFETGDLTGWTVKSGDYSSEDVTSQSYYWHPNPINKEGHFHLLGKDDKQAVLESSRFVLGGTGEINFLIGGGNLNSQYAALIRASDDTELLHTQNEWFADSEGYARATWDASPYLGEELYIRVVDEVAAAGWQHINVDDFHVYNLPHNIENPGFETGDLTGWNIGDPASGAPGRVTSEVNYGHPTPINKNGEYHFWGEDGKEGTLRSTDFQLAGTGEINFLIGGGRYPDTQYVALVRASDDKELIKSTHTAFAGSEGYDRVVWNASAYLGEEVYIKIVDDVPGGGWQHVNADDFRVYNLEPNDIQNPGFETGDLSGWTFEGEAFAGKVTDAVNDPANVPFQHIGTYHVFAGASDAAADSSLQSSTFKLAGTGEIHFLVSGQSDPNNLYTALVKADDGTILFKAAVPELPGDPDAYKRVVLNAKDYIGQSVYIKVVDTSSAGHINVDDFHVYNKEPVSYTMPNEDFEKGNLSGWTVSGDAFTVSDAPAAGKQRNYHVQGVDGARGTLKSGVFRLSGNGTVNFKLAGTEDPDHLYVALVRALDDKVLFQATGRNSETYETVEWNASPFLNEALYFKVVDDSPTGHIHVDDFNYYVSGELINPDFETGDLRGWQVVDGEAFQDVITSQQLFWGTVPFKQNGSYHLWGFQGGGDGRTGILESSHFILEGNPTVPTGGRVTFLLGGGNDPSNLRVELVRDKTGEVLFKDTGFNNEGYKKISWDSTPYIGEELYFRIVDQATGGWGHINVDHFSTKGNTLAVVQNPDFETGDTSGWVVEGEAFQASVSDKTGLNHHGIYHAYGNTKGDSSLKGTLTSNHFELLGNGYIRFLLSGGQNIDNLYAALVRASDDTVLLKTTGKNTDIYQEVVWDARQYVGEEVYIKVVDNQDTGPYGYINVDHFNTDYSFARYEEDFRPQYHFSPSEHWMNDPNGMVYYKGEYHLFYQHNPYGSKQANLSWGHAVSKDLVHWEHLPVALVPDELGQIFSGSAVVDWNNTTGFFDEEGSGLVAIFTYAGAEQAQSLAYSKDKGRTWIKYAGNPVLPPPANTPNFRDPKVFWYDDPVNPADSHWVMSLAVNNKISFYTSKNLKDWEFADDFGADPVEGTHGGVWECPDLIKLPVGNSGESKWVLIVSINPGGVAGGSGTQYFVGDFDGKTFTNSNSPDKVLWLDYGADNYAGVTWSDIPKEDGRTIFYGWMSNWKYANDIPPEVWRSAGTLPRTLELRETPEGIRLIQKPVQELEQLRVPVTSLRDVTITPDSNVLDAVYGDTLEIVAEFEPDTAKEFGFKVLKTETDETVIGYTDNSVFLDRTKAGESGFNAEFAAKHSAPLTQEGNRVKLHLFVDRSLVEVYANDGLRVISDQVFPKPGGLKGLGLYAVDGNVKLVSLDVYRLKSIWRDVLQEIELDSNQYELTVNDTHQSAVQLVHDDNSTSDVTGSTLFESSDPTVATVDMNGLVHGLKAGTTTIHAVYGTFRASAEVLVNGPTVDTTPPTTQLLANSAVPTTGWYNTDPINIQLYPADSASGSGVGKTFYRINGGVLQQYSDPFTLTGAASYTVDYYSQDLAGNNESTQSVTLKLDTKAPVTKYSVKPVWVTEGVKKYIKGYTMALTATDDLSGVKHTLYRLNGGAWTVYSAPFDVYGKHTLNVEFYSEDNAGNKEVNQ